MNICVFGAGSLGSALGGILAQVHDVTLVGRREHIDAIKEHGLRLKGDVVGTAYVQAHEDVSHVQTPDLLVVSTKAYDTSSAIKACRGLIDEKTMVLTLQNGLGNLELLRKWKGDQAFGGTTTMGATLESPGKVRISGLGWTTIGSDVNSQGAERIVQVFRSCGLRVDSKRDVMSEIWGKAVVNACINPTAAVLRVPNGRLLDSETIARFMREVCSECESVSNITGVVLPNRHMYPRVREVCMDTANNISSMLQDVLKGKKTEIHQINGAFCSIGESHNIQTPLNKTLVAMVDCLHRFDKGERLIS